MLKTVGMAIWAALIIAGFTAATTNEAYAHKKRVRHVSVTVVDTYPFYGAGYRGCWIQSRAVIDQWGHGYVGPACVALGARNCTCNIYKIGSPTPL